MPTNLLYGILASLTANGVISLLRFVYARKHKSAILQEEMKQTTLLLSIDRRMQGMEVFGTLSQHKEIIG